MICVAILEDHLGIIDGYRYRLGSFPDIQIVASTRYGEELPGLLKAHPVDVLLLDLQVPTSITNHQPYPIVAILPELLQQHPELAILAISMYVRRALIRAVMESGGCGFIVKDDQDAIQEIGSIIRSVAAGGIYLSATAIEQLRGRSPNEPNTLSARQVQALSLCAAYPQANLSELANKMHVATSTLRNTLAQAYLKLEVHNRFAAVERARELNLILPRLSEGIFTGEDSEFQNEPPGD